MIRQALGTWPLALLMSGCTVLPERPPRPALHDFGLSVPSGTVSRVTVDAPQWLQDDRIRYRLLYADSSQIRHYTLDRWIAPPPMLLAKHFERLDDHGLRPHIQLVEFEQVFERPGEAYVVMALSATAVVRGTGPITEAFVIKRRSATADARGAVAAFATAADDGAARLQDWLSALPSR